MYRYTNEGKARGVKCPATVVTPERSRAVWRALQRRLGAVVAHCGVRSAAQLLRMDVAVRFSALKLRGSVDDGIVARPRRGIAGKTPLRFTAPRKCSTVSPHLTLPHAETRLPPRAPRAWYRIEGVSRHSNA